MIVLIDDTRDFKDGRADLVVREPAAGLAALTAARGTRIDELWLDHDLGLDLRTGKAITVMPVVDELSSAAHGGWRYDIGTIVIHTVNSQAAVLMKAQLVAAGYAVRRSVNPTIWNHFAARPRR